MTLNITINMDNAAFADVNNGTEVARILRKLANSIDGISLTANSERGLLDVNGNRVGKATVSN